MTVYDFITAHPDDHIRIICYVPAPDIIDDHGQPRCGGEGTSTVVFDSTTGEGDLSPDLLLKEITTTCDEETDAGDVVHELEYMPDEYWY